MMQTWATYSVDNYLKEAYEQGIVLAGLSAGAICWAESRYSDSDSFKTEEEWDIKQLLKMQSNVLNNPSR